MMLITKNSASPVVGYFTLEKYQQCLKVGHWLMLSALAMVILCISVSFVFDNHFSLAVQILAHIGTLVFAGLLKMGYVIRCVGAHGLGHKAF